MLRLEFQIYDPSTDIFIGQATTKVAAEGAIVDLMRCGYTKLQLFQATDADTEVLLASAFNAGEGDVEWEYTEVADVNADLIGTKITGDDGVEYTVTGSESWSKQYVKLEAEGHPPTCRQAGLVRRHKQLTQEAL